MAILILTFDFNTPILIFDLSTRPGKYATEQVSVVTVLLWARISDDDSVQLFQ